MKRRNVLIYGLAVLLGFTAGCSTLKPTSLDAAAIYSQLWVKSQSLHLRFEVMCRDGCDAYAWPLRDPVWGWSPYWSGSGSGPTEAANDLLQKLGRAPNEEANISHTPNWFDVGN